MVYIVAIIAFGAVVSPGSPGMLGHKQRADSSRERALNLDAALVGHTHIIRSSVSSLRIN